MATKPVIFKYILFDHQDQLKILQYSHQLQADPDLDHPNPRSGTLIKNIYVEHSLAIEQNTRKTCVRCNRPAAFSAGNSAALAASLSTTETQDTTNLEVRTWILVTCGPACASAALDRLQRDGKPNFASHRAAATGIGGGNNMGPGVSTSSNQENSGTSSVLKCTKASDSLKSLFGIAFVPRSLFKPLGVENIPN